MPLSLSLPLGDENPMMEMLNGHMVYNTRREPLKGLLTPQEISDLRTGTKTKSRVGEWVVVHFSHNIFTYFLYKAQYTFHTS